MKRFHGRATATIVVPALFVILFTAAVVSHGVPSMRHDWYWPDDRVRLLSFVQDLAYGWIPSGIGYPNPYPSGYIVAVPIFCLGILAGPYAALISYIAATGVLAVSSVTAIVRSFGGRRSAEFAAQAFVLFNPWVYNELVAGHYAMVLSYGGILCAVAATRSRNEAWLLSISIIIAFAQLEFFLFVAAYAFFIGLTKGSWYPFITATIVSLPSVVGIVMNVEPLLRTNYILAWQYDQSVKPIFAPLLRGYFAHYDETVAVPFTIGLVLVVGIACAAPFLTKNKLLAVVVVSIVVLVNFCVMGLYGPFARLYEYAVVELPFTGVYRELYNVLGIIAIGYTLLLADVVARNRYLTIVWTIADLSLLSAWLYSPPYSHWVNTGSIPHPAVQSEPNTRFALSPAFAPMSFRNYGSGGDPDLYAFPNNVTPLNASFPSYPVDAALAAFTLRGDTAHLGGLGVRAVFMRPWLSTDIGSLREELAVAPISAKAPKTLGRSSVQLLVAEPELSLSAVPQLGTLNNDYLGRNAFFGDVAGLRGAGVPRDWAALPHVLSVRAPNRCVAATCGWVSASLMFPSSPDLAQGFGGAFTRSPSQLLRVPSAAMVLVSVKGQLLTSRNVLVTRSTLGYRWVRLPGATTALRCVGECAVAAAGQPPRYLPLNPSKHSFRPAPFRTITPWLIYTTISPRATQMLRYTNSFNRFWLAFNQGNILPHFRADAAFNAWIVPGRNGPYTVYICDVTAALQLLLSIVGLLWTCFVLIKAASGSARTSQSEIFV